MKEFAIGMILTFVVIMFFWVADIADPRLKSIESKLANIEKCQQK